MATHPRRDRSRVSDARQDSNLTIAARRLDILAAILAETGRPAEAAATRNIRDIVTAARAAA